MRYRVVLLLFRLVALSAVIFGVDGARGEALDGIDAYLSFKLHGDLGALHDEVLPANSTVSIHLSNGRTFRFDEIFENGFPLPGSPSHRMGESGAASIILSGPGKLHLGTPDSDDMSPQPPLFRAMINDIENGMMYEFMPNVRSGKMTVIGRSHSALPNSAHKHGARRRMLRQRIMEETAPKTAKEYFQRSLSQQHSIAKTPTMETSRNSAAPVLASGPEHRPIAPTSAPIKDHFQTPLSQQPTLITPQQMPTIAPTSPIAPDFTGKIKARHDAPNRGERVDDFLDVMIVWTHQAECANAYPGWHPTHFKCVPDRRTEIAMRSMIDLSISLNNIVLQNSGIPTRLRLVHAYREDSFVENWQGGKQMFDYAIEALTETHDGIMDDVHSKRDFYGADIVSMYAFDHTFQYCGMAWQGDNEPVPESEMFSVVDFRCATSRYTLIHEIAHNLGAWHDRGTLNECDKYLEFIEYGYRHPVHPYRTILAYDCPTQKQQCDRNPFRGNCGIMPILSGPTSKYTLKGDRYHKGALKLTMGNQYADNAKWVREKIREASTYR